MCRSSFSPSCGGSASQQDCKRAKTDALMCHSSKCGTKRLYPSAKQRPKFGSISSKMLAGDWTILKQNKENTEIYVNIK